MKHSISPIISTSSVWCDCTMLVKTGRSLSSVKLFSEVILGIKAASGLKKVTCDLQYVKINVLARKLKHNFWINIILNE